MKNLSTTTSTTLTPPSGSRNKDNGDQILLIVMCVVCSTVLVLIILVFFWHRSKLKTFFKNKNKAIVVKMMECSREYRRNAVTEQTFGNSFIEDFNGRYMKSEIYTINMDDFGIDITDPGSVQKQNAPHSNNQGPLREVYMVTSSKLPPSESIILKPKLPTKPNTGKMRPLTDNLKRKNDTVRKVEYVRTYSSSGQLPRKKISNQNPEFICSSFPRKSDNLHYAVPSNIISNQYTSSIKSNNSTRLTKDSQRSQFAVNEVPDQRQRNRHSEGTPNVMETPNVEEYDVNTAPNEKSSSEYAVPSVVTLSSTPPEDNEARTDNLNNILGDLDQIYSKSKEQRIIKNHRRKLEEKNVDEGLIISVGIFAEKDGKVYYPGAVVNFDS